VQLLNVRDNAAIWATSIDEEVADVFSLEDTLSNRLIEVLLPQLTGSELEGYSRRSTENPEAFEHYLRGRYYFNSFTEEGLAKAFVSFHAAIAADPDYSHAYSGIADYYNWLGIIGVLPPQECFQPAIDAASKAVQLDDDLSEAHASLGFSLHAGNHDWERAEFHLRRAIELNPGNANAYVWYSIVLCTEGRFTDALEFARRSVDLDPLTPFNHHNIGWILYFGRRYDEAIAQYRKVASDFPDYSFAHYGLSKIHRITGRTKEALKEIELTKTLMDNSVFSHLAEAECLAADDQREAAKEKLEDLKKLAEERYVSPYQLSLTYCFLGDAASAIECLERAAEKKEAWLNWMGVEPAFDILRDEAVFKDLCSQFSYRGFLESSMSSKPSVDPNASAAETRSVRDAELHNLTTLVIDQGPDTADTISVTHAPTSLLRRPGLIVPVLLTLLLLLGGGIIWFRSIPDGTSKLEGPRIRFQNLSIVVLPFTADEPANEDIGVGMADALSNRLGNIKTLTVISSNTGRALAAADAAKIEAEIGPGFVLKGKLLGTAPDLKLHAELASVKDNNPLWSEDFAAGDDGLPGIQIRLAEKIWTSLGVEPLPVEREQVLKGFTNNSSAYQMYLIGRYQMTNRSGESLRNAISTFSRAVEQDPGFALGYVGLADAYALLNLYDIDPPKDAYPKALENAAKALSIDDDLAEAHASLAYVKFYHERDRSGAELEFRRAIQMNPSYAQAHHWFALMLSAMNRPVEALSEAQTAQRLDPTSPAIKAATGIVYFMSTNVEEALAECDKALAINKGFVPALKVKRWTYAAIGNRALALETFEKELSYSGGKTTDPTWKIIELQLVPPDKNRDENLNLLAKLINDPPVKGDDFAFAFEIALAYNNLGDTEKAIYWIERAAAANSHSMSFLSVDPRIANLRTDPRFQRMAKKLE
jgi:tetratricopeptide (TPR) repeat protein